MRNVVNASAAKPSAGGNGEGLRPDLTGREHLVSNVLFNWGAYSVYVVAGFIVPRVIDRQLGRELLGVWDFAWSLVSYFGLVQAGIGSSVNRFVARYRVAHDTSGVNRIVSSALCALAVAGVIVLALAVAASLLVPRLFGERLGENLREAQWVVFLLGASLAVQVFCGAFSGVLTGCHRWELHNINTSGWYAATVAGVVVALLLGGGLRIVAAIVLVGQLLTEVRRVMLAYRVCEGLRLRLSSVNGNTIRELLVFGGKTVIPNISNLLLNQTTSILLMFHLGPAALALFARPRSLVDHMTTLVNKMAMVLTPTASSLQSVGDLKEIRGLLLKSVSYSCYLILPMVLTLLIFGGQILRLWMGPDYSDGRIPAILALGYLATMTQTPVLATLAGMNAHGRAGISQLVASLCSVVLTGVALGPLGWGASGAAVAVTLPLTIMNLTYLPWLVCRRVDLSVQRYFLSAVVGPALHVLPFGACLAGARLVLPTKPFAGMTAGMTAGSVVLAVHYWRSVLPAQVKNRMLSYAGLKWKATSAVSR